MTRLEEFADRVTREMLRAYWTEPCDDLTLAATNARIVLTREVREFVTGAVNWQDERSAMDPIEEPRAADWLDCPIAAPTPEQREAPAPGVEMQRAYQDARERYLTHKSKCSRPFCGINAHGNGCEDERRLYDACRDALRERNAASQPTATKPCDDCGGFGEISDGPDRDQYDCPTCHGEGTVPA